MNLVDFSGFRKLGVVVAIIVVWLLLSHSGVWSPLLFPDPVGTVNYILENPDFVVSSVRRSLTLLLIALGASSIVSLTISSVAAQSKGFRVVLETLISMLSPVPGISLLPFAILWFGLGHRPILFITVVGSIAVYTLPIMNGFNTIPSILIDVGRIYGLKKWEMIRHIYFPATLPSILTGLRSAWGLSWRSLVAGELVYGAMGKSAGIGWLITINRYNLNPNGMAVGLLSIVVLGLLMEHVITGSVEKVTVKKWGMKV